MPEVESDSVMINALVDESCVRRPVSYACPNVDLQTWLEQLCCSHSRSGRFRHLECNLNEAAREVLDRNKLSQGRLQDGFKLALSRAYIWIESISK